MLALVVHCINQYIKFEVPSFANTKYMIGSKLKTGHANLTTPLLGVVGHRRLGFDRVYLHANFDDSSFSHSRDIIGRVKI